MSTQKRSILLAASLLAIAAAGALAQGSAGSGTQISTPKNADGNPRRPGATGDAIVRGDPSTVAGDRAATLERRTNNE